MGTMVQNAKKFSRKALTLCAVLSMALPSCGDDDSGAAVAPANVAEFLAPGPFEVGTVNDRVFVDGSRPTNANGEYPGAPDRTFHTNIWYPKDPGVDGPSANGPFPLIGYAHGFISSRGEAADLKAHLASHGYIIIAPDFPLSNGAAPGGPTVEDLANQPGDIAFLMNAMLADPTLGPIIDRQRQGIAGLSLGGATTIVGAYHPTLHVEVASSAVAMAPLACFFGPDMYARNIPTMLIAGDADELVPFETDASHAFSLSSGPTTLVRQIGGTHVGLIGIGIPGSFNSDVTVGCAAVEQTGAPNIDRGDSAITEAIQAGLSGELINDDVCPLTFCENGFEQGMTAGRQTELARIAVLAHFEATLRDRADAAAFIEQVLGAENSDLEVTVKR